MRTDVHKPSSIVVEDYEFVGFEHLKDQEPLVIIEQRRIINEHMKKTGGTYSKHQHGGNCHICGANAVYTALFYHKKTNSYIRTGLECAAILDCYDGERFRRQYQDQSQALAGKKKAIGILTERGLEKSWEIFESQTENLYEENTIKDIIRKLVSYGSLSDAQYKFLRTLISNIETRAERQKQWNLEKEQAKEIPKDLFSGRHIIEGTVLSLKTVDTDFGTVTKMTIRHVDGWKVYGSKPSNLDIAKGDKISFKATLNASKDDPKFGYFSRPSQAKVF